MSRNLLLLGASVAFCLVAGEIGLRALGFGRPLQYEYDEALLWRMVPGQEAYAPAYRVAYRINSRGLRDAEIPARKPPGELRILALGDSVLFGEGVPRDETLAQRLEAALAARGDFASVEVINSGVSGYSAHQYRIFVETQGLVYQPDALLIAFVKNDVVSARDVEDARRRVREGLVPQTGIRDRLRRTSAWMHLGDGLTIRLAAYWRPVPRMLAYDDPGITDAAWDYTLSQLGWIAEAARARNLPLTIAIFPRRDEAETGRVRVPVERLRVLRDRHGANLVELQRAYAARSGEGLFLDPVHPTPLGHAVAADVVLAHLSPRGWVH